MRTLPLVLSAVIVATATAGRRFSVGLAHGLPRRPACWRLVARRLVADALVVVPQRIPIGLFRNRLRLPGPGACRIVAGAPRRGTQQALQRLLLFKPGTALPPG